MHPVGKLFVYRPWHHLPCLRAWLPWPSYLQILGGSRCCREEQELH